MVAGNCMINNTARCDPGVSSRPVGWTEDGGNQRKGFRRWRQTKKWRSGNKEGGIQERERDRRKGSPSIQYMFDKKLCPDFLDKK